MKMKCNIIEAGNERMIRRTMFGNSECKMANVKKKRTKTTKRTIKLRGMTI